MDHGRLVKVGTTNELKKQQNAMFVSIVECEKKTAAASQNFPTTPTGIDGILRASLSGMAVKPVTDSAGVARKYEIDLKYTKLSEVVSLLVELKSTKIISQFTLSQLSLEDVFLNTVGKADSTRISGGVQ
jgi:ABC-type multidrug transport system ATPase subunit